MTVMHGDSTVVVLYSIICLPVKMTVMRGGTGTARPKIGKSHVLLLMQISYPYIVWNKVPKFHENRASSF